MSKFFIVIGDTHSHGGKVTAGAPHSTTGGKAIARLGDPAVCNSHGNTTISSVSGKVQFDGKEAACDGDKLACGATLIASQTPTGHL